MNSMAHDDCLSNRVEKALAKCAQWCHDGRHRKVLAEVERLLRAAVDDDELTATLLIWKAQALLAMGHPERAHPAAARSWELQSSPHSCHLLANALHSMGQAEEAEHLLAMGMELYPDAIHLPLQLVMMLADRARLPEALDILNALDDETGRPEELHAFLFGLKANLLAGMARWSEARDVLEQGLDCHPESDVLRTAHDTVSEDWRRHRAAERLAASWRKGLQPMDGVHAEVDDAILHYGSLFEMPRLSVLAARRLWRAFASQGQVRIVAPDPWAVATILAIEEVDGKKIPTASLARATGTNAGTVRSALRRLRSLLADSDTHFTRRVFGAFSNPMLDARHGPGDNAPGSGEVVQFPGTGKGSP